MQTGLKNVRNTRCETQLTKMIRRGEKNPDRDYTNRRAKAGCPADVRDGKRGVAK